MEVTSNTRLPERRGGLLELTSDQLKGLGLVTLVKFTHCVTKLEVQTWSIIEFK